MKTKDILNNLKQNYNINKLSNIFSIASFISTNIRWNINYLLAFVDNHIIHYPTPINLNYAWSFGSTAGICLVIQIISGIFLAMHYTPHIDLAFSSVEHIMRDVKHGWLIRYIHANGASMFFILSKTIIMVFWSYYFYFNDGNGIYGLCTSLGTNEFLGGYRNY